MNWLSKILKKEKAVEKKEKISNEGVLVKEKSKEEGAGVGQVRGKLAHSSFWAHHLTEKASLSKKEDKYVFKVFTSANKFMIRKAVEERFAVKVKSVNIVNTLGKEIKRGKQIGHKSGLKKAIVTLKEGNNIEVQ